jgi:hypothetical protein
LQEHFGNDLAAIVPQTRADFSATAEKVSLGSRVKSGKTVANKHAKAGSAGAPNEGQEREWL